MAGEGTPGAAGWFPTRGTAASVGTNGGDRVLAADLDAVSLAERAVEVGRTVDRDTAGTDGGATTTGGMPTPAPVTTAMS